jgi:photosystem II stability/assembly factor-like uncharacterized protein
MKPFLRIVSLLTFFSLPALAFQGWVVQSVGTDPSLQSVKAVSAQVVWTCGNDGSVFRSVDGGTSWTEVGGGVLGLHGGDAIEAIGADTAFVCVNDDTAFVYRTTDGGMQWDVVITQPGGFLNAVRMMDPQDGIALGDPMGGTWVVFRTSDGGTTWDRMPTEPIQIGSEFGWVNSLYVLGTTHIWFGTSDHRVYRSTDGGNGWQWAAIDSDDGYGLCFISTMDGVVAGGNGGFRTTDGGETWLPTTLTGPQYAAASSGMTDFWMIYGDQIQASTDRGMTWNVSFEHPGSFYQHLSFVTEGNRAFGWAVGDSGAIAHYDGVVTSATSNATSEIPNYLLWQNSPNPANPSTTIRFQTGKAGHVSLRIFDVLGREVATVVNEDLEAGVHERVWQPADRSSGVYFYRLEAGTFVQTRKMIVVK